MKTILFILIFSSNLVLSQVNQSKLEGILDNLPLPKFSLTYEELKDETPDSYEDEKSPYSLMLEKTESFREQIQLEAERSRNKHGSPQAVMIFARRNSSGDPLKYSQLTDNFLKKQRD